MKNNSYEPKHIKIATKRLEDRIENIEARLLGDSKKRQSKKRGLFAFFSGLFAK